MTTVLTYLDSYCERAGDASLLAEPLNAATNLFFIAAAIFVALLILQLPPTPLRRRGDFWLLALALFSIGIGSGLWHLMPSGKTVLMDVIPITIFIHVYLLAVLRRLLVLRWLAVFGWWLSYLIVSVAAQMILPPDTLHGTVMYLPTYLTIILLSHAVYCKHPTTGRSLFAMVALWTISLIFRTVDLEVCQAFPTGTHFLWHILNAYMLYGLSLILIRKSALHP